MRCPSCRKKVLFGSIASGESWQRVVSGESLHSARTPKRGQLGDCPECGVRLEWEAGEAAVHDFSPGPSGRVHLSALRDSPADWAGRHIVMRSLVVVIADEGFLSDSWRARPKDGLLPENDGALVVRLSREQTPRIEVRFADAECRARFHESSRPLEAGSARAAWAELEGHFALDGDRRALTVESISSIWPPRD